MSHLFTLRVKVTFKPFHAKIQHSLSATSDRGVTVRILGRNEWKDEAQFALDESVAIVDAMSEKFGFNYCDAFNGHCKSDQAGIPQFGAGAMENWGLITYRSVFELHLTLWVP